jgi:hypothetical protein
MIFAGSDKPTIIVWGAAFKEMSYGKLCSEKQTAPVVSEAQCQAASLALGLTFKSAWNQFGTGGFPGCFRVNDAWGDRVYFNLSPNTKSQPEIANLQTHGAICFLTGRLLIFSRHQWSHELKAKSLKPKA